MRARGLAVVIACVVPTLVGAAPAAKDAPFKLVPAHARLGPGEAVQFRIVPAGKTETDVRWIVEGRGVAREGVYRAPYVITVPGERAMVIASRGPRSAPEIDQAIVELVAGVFPGAEDCVAAGQQWEPNGCALAYVPVDELPEAVTRVPPRYPPSARARALEGSLIIQAIVCRSGRVLDAAAQWGVGVTPIPELEDLAVEAAKQWGFKPALVKGQPVATVVAIPFRFPPPPVVQAPAIDLQTGCPEAEHQPFPSDDDRAPVDHPPEPVKMVPPEYPSRAGKYRVDGIVLVHALVCEHGRVAKAVVVKSEAPILNEAAMTAMLQCIYRPAQTGGRPVAAWVDVPFRFTLR